jgi:hypothetical protein
MKISDIKDHNFAPWDVEFKPQYAFDMDYLILTSDKTNVEIRIHEEEGRIFAEWVGDSDSDGLCHQEEGSSETADEIVEAILEEASQFLS